MSYIINTINEAVLVLGVAVCLPRALGELIRACVPVITAVTELRDHISAAKSRGQLADCSGPLSSNEAIAHTDPRAVKNLAPQTFIATYAAGKAIVDAQAAHTAVTEVTGT